MDSKNYTVRYYLPRFGADGKQGSVAGLFDTIMDAPSQVGPVREAGSQVHQVRLHSKSDGKGTYYGFFVRFRDEVPVVGNRFTDVEKPPVLEPDEEVIEKNHFVLFTHDCGREIIAYQMSMEGSDVSAMSRYLTFAAGSEHTISFDEVLSTNALEQLAHGVVKSVEFEVAKPRARSFAPDPADTWTSEAMDYMGRAGATRFKAKLTTTSRKHGLLGPVKDQISLLLNSSLTKSLRVKLSDVDHPLDLFADRIYDKVNVRMTKGWPDSLQMFSEVVAVKNANVNLLPYLVNNDEALE